MQASSATAPFVVMPELVPGIHVPPPPRPRPARTAMPQDVDARNKSIAVRFNFGTGSVPTGGTVSAPPLSPRTCSGVQACPGPRSGETGRERRLTVWTPEQVRGDSRGHERAVRASRNPSLDRTDAPETRLYQRLAPDPPKLNRTAVEQVRA